MNRLALIAELCERSFNNGILYARARDNAVRKNPSLDLDGHELLERIEGEPEFVEYFAERQEIERAIMENFLDLSPYARTG